MVRVVAVSVRVMRMVGVRRVRRVRMVRMVGMVRMVHVRQVGVRRVRMVAVPSPAAAGYARPSAVGIPTATLRQARAAFAALTCRCNQRAKNEKEGEHVLVFLRLLAVQLVMPNGDNARAFPRSSAKTSEPTRSFEATSPSRFPSRSACVPTY